MGWGWSELRAAAAVPTLVLVLLGSAASANAATTVGTTSGAPTNCGAGGAETQSSTVGPPSYTIPSDGVITSFTAFSNVASAQSKLLVLESVAPQTYRIVAKGDFNTFPAPGPGTFSARIPVRQGQQIGIFGLVCAFPSTGDVALAQNTAEPGVGAPLFFSSVGNNFRMELSAQLEPDCDGDGFGDETQDSDTLSCPPAPETTITKGPKDKTKKKQARFKFSASEAGATFECSLDGATFAPCTSPHRVKVKKGKHSFEVRAKDPGNNVDGSPATDDWKVKKKKR